MQFSLMHRAAIKQACENEILILGGLVPKAQFVPVMLVVAILQFAAPTAEALADCERDCISIDLPAMEAREAVMRLAAVSGRSVLFRTKSLSDIQSNPVSGVFSFEDALDRLLSDTAVEGALTESGVIVVSHRQNNGEEGTMSRKQRNILMTSVSAALGWLSVTGVQAQDVAGEVEDSEDTIIIQGYRQSLAEATQMKRTDNRIVDAIVAEDIGKLPDNNVAEALQRVTGVSVSRTFGVGESIQIRGLSQNRVELNGRSTLGDQRQGLNLDDFPADLLAAVEVVKSPTPKMIEGALGGTVNLRTRRPLELRDRIMAVTLKGEYGDDRAEWSPIVNGIYADNWDAGSSGNFGMLLNLSYQDRKLQREELVWRPFARNEDLDSDGTNEVYLLNSNFNPKYGLEDRERTAANLTLEWEPESQNGRIYSEFTITDNEVRELSYALFTGQGTVDRNQDYTFTEDGLELNTWTERVGLITPSSEAYTRFTDTFNGVIGGEWEAGAFNFSGEYSYVESETFQPQGYVRFRARNDANTSNTGFNARVVRDGETLVSYDILSDVDFTDPSIFVLRQIYQRESFINNDETAGRFDISYEPETPLVTSIDVGIRATERNFDTRRDEVNISNLESFNVRATAFGDDLQPGFDLGEWLDAEDISFGEGDPNWVALDPRVVDEDFDRLITRFGELGVPYPGVMPLLDQTNAISEETFAAYFQANLEGEIGTVPFSAVGGVRYVETDVESAGFVPNPETRELEEVSDKGSYDKWLPSVNVRMDIKDDLTLRLAAAKVMRRPDFDLLLPGVQTARDFVGNRLGNPGLDPFEATQYDASLEWYFDDASLLSFAVFYKDVAAFLKEEGVCLNRPDLVALVRDEFLVGQCRLSGSGPIETTTPRDQLGLLATTTVNGESGSVSGFEIGYQDTFDTLPAPFDGLGVVANYTYADSETPDEGVQLANISEHSYNLIGFYEKGKISTRLAYSYRTEYLRTTFEGRVQDVCANFPDCSGDPTLGNVTADARGILDFSSSYDVNDSLKLQFEVTNILKSGDQDSSAVGDPYFVFPNDRRFLLSIRAQL